MQDTLSSSTLHVSIENNYSEDREESINIYMSEDEIQYFINKLQSSLNKRKKR